MLTYRLLYRKPVELAKNLNRLRSLCDTRSSCGENFSKITVKEDWKRTFRAGAYPLANRAWHVRE